MKLSEDLKKWRVDRPDEWTMDRFIEKSTKEVYRYKVNQGGPLGIRVSNGSDRHVEIIFINGKLESVSNNFGDFNLRSNWRVFGAISQKIAELEERYASEDES